MAKTNGNEPKLSEARMGQLIEAARVRNQLEVAKSFERKTMLGAVKDLVTTNQLEKIKLLMPAIEKALQDVE